MFIVVPLFQETSPALKSLWLRAYCSYLNLNPVLLARQFQYRVEAYFQTRNIINGPLGRVKYYAISPHKLL